MLRIEKLSVKNIGPFTEQEFVFPRKTIADKAEIHVFTGENGTGKTTVLEMLSSITHLNPKPGQKRRSEHSAFSISFGEMGVISYEYGNNALPEKIPSFVREYRRKLSIVAQSATDLFQYAFFAYSGHRNIGAYKLTSIGNIDKNPFENALSFTSASNITQLTNWIANQKTREALATVRNDPKTANEYGKSIKRIENVIERIIEEPIEFQLLDNPLRVVIKKSGVELDLNLLPDGLKSMISWISDLLMRLDLIGWVDKIDVLDRNFILFLDEIDVHLHPAWQRKILPVIQDLFKNAQIFITTHSPFVVGSVDGVWIHRLTNQNNETIVQDALPSEDSKSYELILDEVFGIDKRFGINIERTINEFRNLRNTLLRRVANNEILNEEDLIPLKKIALKLSDEPGIEVKNIIGSELRQLSRFLKMEVSI